MLKFDQGAEESGPAAPGLQRFACPSCGADMAYDPAAGMLKCPYCGHTEAVSADTEGVVAERSLHHYLTPRADTLRRLSEKALQVSCTGCGSTIEFEPPEVAGVCPFCGAKIVAQPRAADPLVAPEGVLPFGITQKQAGQSIQQWIQTRWFAPNALKKQAAQDRSQGVYLPFWTYDAKTRSRYTGQRGQHYWETEHYTTTDSNGKTVRQSRQVRKTRWYPASGTVARAFDDVLVPATTAVQRPRLDALEPWDLPAVQPYTPAFLSGFKAQRYQVDIGQGFARAKEVMAGVIHEDVCRDIGGDEQRVHHVDTRYAAVTFKHLLLPVWISAYRYRQKVYQVVVNARTGEVQGERPYSVWKITLLMIFIVAALLTLYYFYSGSGGR